MKRIARVVAIAIACALFSQSARAEIPSQDTRTIEASVTEPHTEPTLLWTLMQLIPSPEFASGSEGSRFGFRWQVTPLLYSFGINKRLSPWRTFVVEPLMRNSGSIELYFSPEFFTHGYEQGDPHGIDAASGSSHFLLRPGIRATIPLIAHGDYLSASIGTSIYRFEERTGEAAEIGVYSFFGGLGFQFTYSPNVGPVEWIATLRIRYF
jgi:hypothetical protein